MLCTSCGKDNEPGSKYCIFCGGEIKVEPKPGRLCAKCGTNNPVHVMYCGTCGNSLMVSAVRPLVSRPQTRTATVEPKPAPVDATPEPTAKPTRVCTACGKSNDSDAKFCDSCGTELLLGGATRTRCANCGALNETGSARCEVCGEVMTSYYGASEPAFPTEEYEEDEVNEISSSQESGDDILKELWDPVYSRFWESSPMSSSGPGGFILFLMFAFIIIVIALGALSGSWAGAFCGTVILFFAAIVLLGLVSYSRKSLSDVATSGDVPPENPGRL